MKIAVNGFGRIGRNFLRAFLGDPVACQKAQIVAINIGPSNPHFVAHSFKYDTLLGVYPGSVSMEDDMLVIDGHKIKILAHTDPTSLPWKALAIDWVVEATGKFVKKSEAQKHCTAGARAVLISAPCQDADALVIMGVNESDFDRDQHTIVSAGSCTTNALVPLLQVILSSYKIQAAYMTTVHAYTNDQVLLDVDHKSLRRGRAAALNIIPTTTGASSVVTKVFKELEGKIEGCALRVPVSKVSLCDLSFVVDRPLKKDELNKLFEKAQTTSLKGILSYTQEPLVSADFSNNPHSVIIDGQMTEAVGTLGKVFGWYDNEWAYSCRLKDFLIKYT